MSGSFRWTCPGGTIVGRTFAVVNAGTHHAPVSSCEDCYMPQHAEGWLRGAVVGGKLDGARVNGAVAYNFEMGGGGVNTFDTDFEGLMIIQCNDG